MIKFDNLIKFIPNKMVPGIIFQVVDTKVISKSNKGQMTRLGSMNVIQAFYHIQKALDLYNKQTKKGR